MLEAIPLKKTYPLPISGPAHAFLFIAKTGVHYALEIN